MFDRVFDGQARQMDVYESTAMPLLDGLLDGYNATVFAYGVRVPFLQQAHRHALTNTRLPDAGKLTQSAAAIANLG